MVPIVLAAGRMGRAGPDRHRPGPHSCRRDGVSPEPDAECHAIGVPGLPNVHSHAFQRGMAGLTEVPGRPATTSGHGAKRCTGLSTAIDPDDIEAIAAFAYMEMLEAGFTRVGEFHYVHHDRGGRPFADPAEMASSIAAARGRPGSA